KPRAGCLNNEAGMRHYGQHAAPHANRLQRRPTKAVKTMVVIQSTLSRALPTGYCETPSGISKHHRVPVPSLPLSCTQQERARSPFVEPSWGHVRFVTVRPEYLRRLHERKHPTAHM